VSDSVRLKPVFLLAPMNRSGTKFLKSVLLAHPRMTQGFSLEDYSLAYSDKLLEFAASMARHWARSTEEKTHHRQRLIDAFGPFLLDFFSEGADTAQADWLLLTTPRPWGIGNLFRLFPDSRLIILVRDGKDTVESASRTFKGPGFRVWIDEWARGAGEVLRFADAERASRGTRWEMVDFESLARDPEEVGRRLCKFLGLAAADVDWRAVKAGPVRGSSEHGGPSHQVARSKDFNPVGRAAGWSWLQRLQFQYVAGATDKALQQRCRRES
jgi:hypothetical protein